MPTSKGGDAARRYIATAPQEFAAKVLPGAARAGGKVIADEAKSRSVSETVAENIIVRAKSEPGRVVVKVTVKGQWPLSLGIWQEYGTTPHFIRVDDEQRAGRSAARINRLDSGAAQEGRVGPGEALRIGGNFVTGTVRHPGAERHPFLRVALDAKEGEAIAAAQGYINTQASRLKAGGLPDDGGAEG